jgi:hypothetical protein
MPKEVSVQQLIAALPTDGTALSNKRIQEQLKWSKLDYERIREEALTQRLVKKAPGQGGSLRRYLTDVFAPTPERPHLRDSVEPPDVLSDKDAEPSGDPYLLSSANLREDFALQLHRDLEASCEQGRMTYDEALVDFVLRALGEDQFDEPTACSYVDVDSFSNEVRLRIDGYDLHEEDHEDRVEIDLFVVYGASPLQKSRDGATTLQVPVIEGSAANALFRAARRFVEESLRDLDREISSNIEASDVARSIKASKRLARVNINLITNAEARQFDRTPERIGDVEIHKRALDINHLRRLFNPDAIEVDFSAARSGGIPCVALPEANDTYRSYLAVVPGEFLAALYGRYRQRLLEANVRSYLKASNHSVNQGIIETIARQPERFFAYNNGITATADELVAEPASDGGLSLLRCRNLQIVNGGQTTASLFHATVRKIPLDRVFVPMKINEVIDRARSAEIVQAISYSANRQNKVHLSDLGANQPFHIALQTLANSEVPPEPAKGVLLGSHWTYERMRGQYLNDVNLERTPAKKRIFQQKYPKSQVLSKTDVARYYMTWNQMPFSVCHGSEKNYTRFRTVIGQGFVPDALWFRHLVAKAILVETCDEIVMRQKVPGFKANIVAYAVALLAHVEGDRTDLDEIWRTQRVHGNTVQWLEKAIPIVREHIMAPSREGKNVGEISKKEDCWKRLVDSWRILAR